MAADFGRRFEELCRQAGAIEDSKRMEQRQFSSGYRIDPSQLLNWQVKVRHLIVSVCGEDSQHFKLFVHSERPGAYVSGYDIFQKLHAVLLAAKEDYEGGYLNKIRNLIKAEVFDDELEQASELLNAGYTTAAAVVTGVVLETSLRQMCSDNGLASGKLDKMNADLAKAGVYNKLVQKQITAWAAIRNSAAHGQTGEFKKDDVVAMVRDVQRFLADRLT